MFAYQTNADGYFTVPVKLNPDPMVPNGWLVPAGAVMTPPPEEGPEGWMAWWNGTDWDMVEPPKVTSNANHLGPSINLERDERVKTGSTFTLSTGKIIPQGGTDQDTRNLQALAFGALMRQGLGDNETITEFRDRDNDMHDLTPGEILELWSLGSAFVQMLYKKSWELKSMEWVPENWQDDVFWEDE